MTDVTNAGSLSGKEQIGQQAIGMIIPGMGGMIAGVVAKKGLQAGHTGPTAQLVDTWNQQFFHPRRMEVILSQGGQRLDSGQGPVPPMDQEIEQLSAMRDEKAAEDFAKDQEKMKKKMRKNGGGGFGGGMGGFGGMVPQDNLCRLFVVGF